MITIKNTQRSITLDIKHIQKIAQKILDILDYRDFDLGIWFCSDNTMRKYNKQYRHKDKVTDILSFPYHPHLKAGQRIKVHDEEDKNIGDLLIAPHYVQKDASNWQQTVEQRLPILFIHGICHLLGYNHIKDEDYEIMRKEEERILKEINSLYKLMN